MHSTGLLGTYILPLKQFFSGVPNNGVARESGGIEMSGSGEIFWATNNKTWIIQPNIHTSL